MRRLLPILCVVLHALPLKAHSASILNDSTKGEQPIYILGQFTTTDKGISLFPAFSLGRPATMLEMKIGGRFHVDPELRYATDGTPWSYIAWMRYEWLNTPRLTCEWAVMHRCFFLKRKSRGPPVPSKTAFWATDSLRRRLPLLGNLVPECLQVCTICIRGVWIPAPFHLPILPWRMGDWPA